MLPNAQDHRVGPIAAITGANARGRLRFIVWLSKSRGVVSGWPGMNYPPCGAYRLS
ncbi:hypothetical protein CA13_08880 [Planctomycetes bacterium CA13]|uniref:Uncharacterized protein n=1 Tax=Novipirellula herctigrandis TaxID=2527986 RepID=A0A5C5YXI9_9BACT|nr:hypothetical protein CA13_08880 [Planctomycetes bacterium CA13]